jgi:two-component system, sensor histidine kinase and response regulator
LSIESNTYETNRARSPLPGARILLVVDNGAYGQSLGDMLKQQGLDVDAATSAEQVLTLLRSKDPDLILMDMQIPEMDGYQVAQTIRREKRFGKIPIIAMTAHTMTGDREKYFQVGMNDYISKPIFPDRLYAVLRGWLSVKNHPKPTQHPADERHRRLAQLAKALPGFDVAEALTRLEGNLQFYKEMLVDLSKNLVAARSEMRPLICDGGLQSALIRLHGLKGVCANLDATALHHAFQNLEFALATSKQIQYDRLISRMEQTIDENLTAIGAFLEADADNGADTPPPDAVNQDLLVETMRQLIRLLDQRRLDAIDSIEQLKEMLGHRNSHPEFNNLSAAMRRLDYASARKALIALAASANINL